MSAPLRIEVAYAASSNPVVIALEVAPGATLREAIGRSGLEQRFALDFRRNRVGVFGQLRGLDEPVADGDRIEIYRPLTMDPKEARRQRAHRHSRGVPRHSRESGNP